MWISNGLLEWHFLNLPHALKTGPCKIYMTMLKHSVKEVPAKILQISNDIQQNLLEFKFYFKKSYFYIKIWWSCLFGLLIETILAFIVISKYYCNKKASTFITVYYIVNTIKKNHQMPPSNLCTKFHIINDLVHLNRHWFIESFIYINEYF